MATTSLPITADMPSTGGVRTACVTGGNGYIASALVKMLLQRGYAVKTTVRNPGLRCFSAALLLLLFFPLELLGGADC